MSVQFWFKVFIMDQNGLTGGARDSAKNKICSLAWPSPTPPKHGCAAITTKQDIPKKYTYDFTCDASAKVENDEKIVTFDEGISCHTLISYDIAVVRGSPRYEWDDVPRVLVPLESVDPTRVPAALNTRAKDSNLPGCFKPQKRCVLEIKGADGNTDVIVRGVCTLLEQYACPSTCNNGQVRRMMFAKRIACRLH